MNTYEQIIVNGPLSPAERIASFIYWDIVERQGIGDALESIGDDIVSEMLDGWIKYIEEKG